MAHTDTADLTAAWYAAAPPPPPSPRPRAGSQVVQGGAIQPHMIKSSSSSSSLGFDRRAKGDDIPSDSHSPEPERPISRNAIAKQRERERQRARTNSTSTVTTYSHPQQDSHPHMRERYDSSPSTAAPWSTYPQQQLPYDYSVPLTTQAVQYPAYPSQGSYQSQIPHTYPQPEPPMTQMYPFPAQSPAIAGWNAPRAIPAQPPHPNEQGYYEAPKTTQAPLPAQPPAHHSHHTPWQAQGSYAPVPFPTETMSSPMPPPMMPPLPSTHIKRGGGARPLPSPSRTSSQSSSVGAGSSSPSLGSISGNVRRSLPQPPASPMTRPSAADTPKLGRNDSVRMAAEEIMARGAPRRKNMSAGSKFIVGGSNCKSNGSIKSSSSVQSTGDAEKGQAPPPPPTTSSSRNSVRVGRAESASCLDRELREMKLQEDRCQDTLASSYADVPVREICRAASPRPVRAAPTPAPEVSISSPIQDVIPSRPRSRGPKDERERRRSMAEYDEAKSPQITFSPPPDTTAPRASLTYDDSSPILVRPGLPSVFVRRNEEPAIQVDKVTPKAMNDMPSMQVNELPSISVEETPSIQVAAVPSIEVDMPSIHVQSESSEESEGSEDDHPKASISISVSSSNMAQRSTTTVEPTATPYNYCHDSNSRHTAPASASSVGSGASCATCQKWIGGRVVHAMSLTFHPDCFVCCHCSEHLEHVAFYDHEGRPYCHFDYHELFSKRCFHCRTPIVDQRYITINDVELTGGSAEERCYHDLHFFCANCGDPFLDPKVASSAAGSDPMDMIEDDDGKVRFGGREFVVHKGYPYCEKCHVNLHKPRCKGCKKPIVEADFLTALKAKWHLNCFCCEICQHPISSENFYVKDGKAYDEECYKIKLRSEL